MAPRSTGAARGDINSSKVAHGPTPPVVRVLVPWVHHPLRVVCPRHVAGIVPFGFLRRIPFTLAARQMGRVGFRVTSVAAWGDDHE